MLPEKQQEQGLELRRQGLKPIDFSQVQGKLSNTDISIYQSGTKSMLRFVNPEEFSEKFEEIVEFIMKDVGLRQERLEKYQMIRLKTLTLRYYSNMTVSDIKLAFELLMIGELDEFLPKNRYQEPDKAHYGEFSADYYTKILNAFRKRKNVAVSGILQLTTVHKETIITEEEKEELDREFVRRCYNIFLDYKEGKEQPDWYFSIFLFNFYKRLGIIKKDIEATDADLRRAKTLVFMENQVTKYEKTYITSIGEAFRDHPTIKKEAASIAQVKIIKEAFDEIIKKKINLKKTIEKHEGIEL